MIGGSTSLLVSFTDIGHRSAARAGCASRGHVLPDQPDESGAAQPRPARRPVAAVGSETVDRVRHGTLLRLEPARSLAHGRARRRRIFPVRRFGGRSPVDWDAMAPEFTHLDPLGRARMVDVTAKEPSHRRAVARCRVYMEAETASRIASGAISKGDVLAVARVAGIQAAKQTPHLLPLCHPLLVGAVLVNFRLEDTYVEVEANVDTVDRTGVEMEAITAAAIAALTIYDMCKSVDRSMTIGDLSLWEKTGGRSGTWRRPVERSRSRSRFDRRMAYFARILGPSSIDPPAIVTRCYHTSDRGGREVLTLPVLIILAVLWAVVLVPPFLRSRSQRTADSIVDFNSSSTCSAVPTAIVDAPTRCRAAVAPALRGCRLCARARRNDRRKRRRDVAAGARGVGRRARCSSRSSPERASCGRCRCSSTCSRCRISRCGRGCGASRPSGWPRCATYRSCACPTCCRLRARDGVPAQRVVVARGGPARGDRRDRCTRSRDVRGEAPRPRGDDQRVASGDPGVRSVDPCHASRRVRRRGVAGTRGA